MGAVGSRPDDGSAIYFRDQTRFSISNLTITAKGRTVLSIAPNTFPATQIIARRDAGDETPIEYIQDPESPSNSLPSFLLRLNNDDELLFNFSIKVRQTQPASIDVAPQDAVDAVINGLTFIFAPTAKELDVLVTREFHADPNLHKNANVELVRSDISTAGSPSVQVEYTWKWRPPKPAEDRSGGYRTACTFVEYDQRAHRLNTLASFAFWVQGTRLANPPAATSPPYDMLAPPRIRLASSHSAQSGVTITSDSEGPFERDPASPIAESEPVATSSSGTASAPIIDVACPRPGEDLSTVDDGPLFRATMKALEQKTGTMRARMKKVLKRAGAAKLAQAQCNEAMAQFMESLRDASNANDSAIQPALEHYFDKIAREILIYENENSMNLQRLIIDPLSKLYNLDIKQAEAKKRDFEDESKEYYSYVSRYLGQRQDSLKEKKRIDSDSKYQHKRRNFELKRFDYSSFMQDLHGGRKEQEVLSQLTKYAETQAKSFLATGRRIEEMAPQLDALIREVTEVDKEFQIQRTEREEKRRTLEKSTKNYGDSDATAAAATATAASAAFVGTAPTADADLNRSDSSGKGTLHHSGSTASQATTVGSAASTLGPSSSLRSSGPSPVTSPGHDRTRTFRENDERNGITTIPEKGPGQQRKEGLLWALSRPGSHVDPRGLNKQAWHKFWVVLDQGKLSEYSNWKEGLELHMDPIDLRLASVREARNVDRRFCLEVITPSYKRVYQAPSEEDLVSWISSINNALQSAFETREKPQPFDASPNEGRGLRRDIGSVLTGKSSSASKDSNTTSSSTGTGAAISSEPARRTLSSARPIYMRSDSASYIDNPKKLLHELRQKDERNTLCADCSSPHNTDWASINLGVILCIECSGIHRSLGTHVSKVRSLTLDVTAFTVDIVEIMMTVGNRVSNGVWEALLDGKDKINHTASWDERRHFITQKYAERAYVAPLAQASASTHVPSSDDKLLASIKKNDISQVLHALALRANPNALDRSRNTHALFLALAAADPASPHSLSAASSPGRPTSSHRPGASSAATSPGTTKAPPFAVAELLLQNGGELPTSLPAFPLSPAAQQFLDQRRARSTLVSGFQSQTASLSPGGRTGPPSASMTSGSASTIASAGSGSGNGVDGGINAGGIETAGFGSGNAVYNAGSTSNNNNVMASNAIERDKTPKRASAASRFGGRAMGLGASLSLGSSSSSHAAPTPAAPATPSAAAAERQD